VSDRGGGKTSQLCGIFATLWFELTRKSKVSDGTRRPESDSKMLSGYEPAREPLSAHTVRGQDVVAVPVYLHRNRSLQFSESDNPWQAVPRWAEFLINCGYTWGDPVLSRRRIGVFSMPCESAAASLVALGAMCRRLTVDGANDVISHYQRIERLATNKDTETYLRHGKYKGRFHLEGKDRDGVIWVRSETAESSRVSSRTRLTRVGVLPLNACDWYFDGEAPVQAAQGAQLPYGDFYAEFTDSCAPIRANFSHSDSGICLAGRAAGESVSRSVSAEIRFQNRGCVADLSQLLTIHNWSLRTISRVTFFNTRTGHLDRNTGLTRLVVADGDAAFLKVIEAAEFRSSNVLGVIHRAIERERLEVIGVKLAELAQWYTTDTVLQNGMPLVPPGITILALQRR
jgi:hypothetical protein